ncbi:MAG: thioredoxin-dependent thiol peroxidase [Gemmatimonadaceae bacterium]
MLNEQDQAPDFTLPSDDGGEVTLSALRGRWVVLYFYPKDDTSGCTTQACGFRDSFPRFGDLDAVILGVSPDDVKSHQKFRAKFDLPFTLLADTAHSVAERYDVWKEKSMYGRKYMGIERTTFLIAPDGRIARIFAKVKPAGHAEAVAEAIASAA